MSFPPGTEMFQFPGFLRESRDRCLWGGSPEHIAAFNARFQTTPRHPPHALRSLATPTRPGNNRPATIVVPRPGRLARPRPVLPRRRLATRSTAAKPASIDPSRVGRLPAVTPASEGLMHSEMIRYHFCKTVLWLNTTLAPLRYRPAGLAPDRSPPCGAMHCHRIVRERRDASAEIRRSYRAGT
jgi:hypothetical protein